MDAKQYDLVLFNYYGTLVHHEVDETQESAWTALRRSLYDDGADYVTNDRLKAQFQRAKAKLAALCGRDGTDAGADDTQDLLEAYEALFDNLWIEGNVEMSKRAAWTFRKAATRKLTVVDGALDCLRQLKRHGKRIILLSNSQACYTRPEIEELGLAELFDGVVISSDEGVTTASAEIYGRILEREQVPAERVLMVSNDETCDVVGAQAAGIDAVLLKPDVIRVISNGVAQRDAEREIVERQQRAVRNAITSSAGGDYRSLVDFILKEGTTAVVQRL